MTAIAERLDKFLAKAKPASAEEVKRVVGEVLEWAEADATDLMHSRVREQEVLDELDRNDSTSLL